MEKIISLAFIFLIFFIFKNWFLYPEIIGGDWPFFFEETLKDFPLFPPSWSTFHGNGFGGIIPGYFIDQYLYLTINLSLHVLSVSWEIGYKIFWFGLFILISIFSSLKLAKFIFPNNLKIWYLYLVPIIYISNTYILMIVAGGQMGIAMAYAIYPFILTKAMSFINKKNFIKITAEFGFLMGLQLMFDPRVFFISLISIFIFSLIKFLYKLQNSKLMNYFVIYILIFPFVSTVLAVLLNCFWILPFMYDGFNFSKELNTSFKSIEALKFLSFASFSQSFSILHPNWPENIFGKIYFMRSEFLLFPIIAFISVFLIKLKKITNQSNSKKEIIGNEKIIVILFFSCLAIIGSFLAKGTNPPFGELNAWLFNNFPVFFVFRDPTKFYIMITISYSVLIPFSLFYMSILLKKYIKFDLQLVICIIFLLFWIILINPIFFNNLSGTFKKNSVPSEYIKLKDFLHKQPEFFRTLWIPKQQRFSFFSINHPAVEARVLYSEENLYKLVNLLEKDMLGEYSIKYIIVPYDSLGEIFLKNREYDYIQYKNLIKKIENIKWLKKISTFENIGVFELSNYKDHFWLNGNGKISYNSINLTKYNLKIFLSSPANLTFSENYHPDWVAKINGDMIRSIRTKDNLNSFYINKIGNYDLEVSFVKNEEFFIGRLISFFTILVLVITILIKR